MSRKRNPESSVINVMDKAEIMLYLHNHKSEDSDTILLVFENTRAMNH